MPRLKHFKNAAGSRPPLRLQHSDEQVSSTYPTPETGIPKRKKKIYCELFNIALALTPTNQSPDLNIRLRRLTKPLAPDHVV